jgi:hypothetical protein
MRATLAAALCLAAPAIASADDELEVKWKGRVQTDLQLRIERKSIGHYWDRLTLPPGPEWARGTLGLDLSATYGKVRGVAELEVVVDGFSAEIDGLPDLSDSNQVDPVRIEARNLYVELRDLFTQGLDVRLGQQVIAWGVGDQFNPTNDLSGDDLRDRLLFGRLAGNFMARADYWATDDLSFSGVLVPVFKPALLPRSAPLGVGAIDRLPFLDNFLRHRIAAENAAAAILDSPAVVERAEIVLPEKSFSNMPFLLRAAATIADQNLALSYYRGRTDFPQPRKNHIRYDASAASCNPDNASDCTVAELGNTVTLWYPRMQVIGLNATGEIPLDWISEALRGIGYRFEAALVLPKRATISVTNEALPLAGMPQPAGEYDYDGDGVPGGPRPAVVEADPFFKWAIGLDYTIARRWYVNAQWVHGLPDEYGGNLFGGGRAIRESGVSSDPGTTLLACAAAQDGTRCASEIFRPKVADYLVVGVDLKLRNDALLLRMFTIWDLSGYSSEQFDVNENARVTEHHSLFSKAGFSAVIYPELNYNFGNGLDLGLGALFQLGKTYTKFGDPAAGGSLVWTRARMAF